MASKSSRQEKRVWQDKTSGHTVVDIAIADVGKDITFDGAKEAPVVSVRPGDRVEFRLEYRLRDEDRRKDDWRFRMDLSVDGTRTRPRIERIDDNPDVKDAYSGNVAKTIRFNHPGDYQVRVDVRAEHDVTEWASEAPRRHEMRSQTMTVPVHVD
jgi:hypothetical protein